MESLANVTTVRRNSPPLTASMAAEIKALSELGMMQHDIAARFKINQGRVSEVLSGKRFSGTAPDPQGRLF